MRHFAVALLGAAFVLIGQVHAAHAAEPASNVEMLRGVVTQATGSALAGMPSPNASSVALRAASTHPANWMIEQALLEALSTRGIHATPSAPADSGATASAPSSAAIVEYRGVDVSLDYVKSRVAVATGEKFVSRAGRASIALRLLAAGSGEVLWAHDGSASTHDEVPDALLKSLATPQVPLTTQPVVPVARLTRYTEPLLVTLIVGGLISLFYANK